MASTLASTLKWIEEQVSIRRMDTSIAFDFRLKTKYWLELEISD